MHPNDLLAAMMPTGWSWDAAPWFVPDYNYMAVRNQDATVVVSKTQEELLAKVRYLERAAYHKRWKQRQCR